MLYVIYGCPACKKEVSSPLCPEITIPVDEEIVDMKTTCPACNKEFAVQIACRFTPPKKKGGIGKKKKR